MILIPTVVLLPQWVIDDINKCVPDIEKWMTEKMRANGWSTQMLAGGWLFIKSYQDAVAAHVAR